MLIAQWYLLRASDEAMRFVQKGFFTIYPDVSSPVITTINLDSFFKNKALHKKPPIKKNPACIDTENSSNQPTALQSGAVA